MNYSREYILRLHEDGSALVAHRGDGVPTRRLPYFRCERCNQCYAGDSYFIEAKRVCEACKDAVVSAKQRAFEAVTELRRRKQSAARAKAAGDRRAEAMAHASVPWADKKAIRRIYVEAKRRSRSEGVRYSVDHIYPIQSPDCCGLHNEFNLRIVPLAENCSKSNGMPYEHEITPYDFGDDRDVD